MMIKQHTLNPISLFGFTLILFLLNACGTFEIGFEHSPELTPTTVTISPDEVVPSKTPAPTVPNPTATLSPTPTVERILFTSGATQATVEGDLPANGAKVYVIGIAADQFVEMNAAVGAMGQGLRFSIVGADGAVVKTMGEAHVRTVVPSTQDYYVELASDVGAVSYRMSVLIPVRIRLTSSDTSVEIAGSLTTNGERYYILHAAAGQRLIITPRATQGQVGLVISGADGQVLLGGHVANDGYDGIITTTQDYLISVRAEGETGADYVLVVAILPP